MKVTLAVLLEHDAGLLKKVVGDVTTNGIALEIEVDVHVLAKPRRVIVAVGFGVAERLQDCV